MINALSVMALVLSLTGSVCINYRKQSGFIVWIASNVLWIAVNLIGTLNVSQIVMFLVYIIFNVQGWLNWRKK